MRANRFNLKAGSRLLIEGDEHSTRTSITVLSIKNDVVQLKISYTNNFSQIVSIKFYGDDFCYGYDGSPYFIFAP
jgi:hypothetical protein